MTPLARFAGVAMIHATLPEMGDTADNTFVRFNVDRAAAVATAANRLGRIEIPWVMREMAIGQRANRADRDTHAAVRAERVFKANTVRRRDARLSAADRRLDRGDADHLVAHARAAGAHDAAIPLVVDRVAEMGIRLRELWPAVGI